jgi:hypothetical protein
MARRSAAEAAETPARAARHGADPLRHVRCSGQFARAAPLLGRRRHRRARRGLPSQHGRDRRLRGVRGPPHERTHRQPGGGCLQGSEALRGRHRDHHQEPGPTHHPQPVGAARPLPHPGREGAGQAQLPGAKAGARAKHVHVHVHMHVHGMCMCMCICMCMACACACIRALLQVLELCTSLSPSMHRCSSCATSCLS